MTEKILNHILEASTNQKQVEYKDDHGYVQHN